LVNKDYRASWGGKANNGRTNEDNLCRTLDSLWKGLLKPVRIFCIVRREGAKMQNVEGSPKKPTDKLPKLCYEAPEQDRSKHELFTHAVELLYAPFHSFEVDLVRRALDFLPISRSSVPNTWQRARNDLWRN
jgi:hypothetical protein